MRTSLIVLALLIATPLFAQQNAGSTADNNENPSESQEESKKKKKDASDTVKVSLFPPLSFRLSGDLMGLTRTFVQDGRRELEMSVDAVFYRYFLTFDYGLFETNRIEDDFEYNNSGSFFRAGVDINFLHKDPDRSALFIGFRYGQSRFDDDITYSFVDSLDTNEIVSRTGENSGMRASWFELTTGLKVKIFKNLMLGYTARFKFALSLDNSEVLQPFDVPGYGRAETEPWYGFNYYLIYRFPFKKDKRVSPLLKKKVE